MAIFVNAEEGDRKPKTPYPGGAAWWNFERVTEKLKGGLRHAPKPQNLHDEEITTTSDVGDLQIEEL